MSHHRQPCSIPTFRSRDVIGDKKNVTRKKKKKRKRVLTIARRGRLKPGIENPCKQDNMWNCFNKTILHSDAQQPYLLLILFLGTLLQGPLYKSIFSLQFTNLAVHGVQLRFYLCHFQRSLARQGQPWSQFDYDVNAQILIIQKCKYNWSKWNQAF